MELVAKNKETVAGVVNPKSHFGREADSYKYIFY